MKNMKIIFTHLKPDIWQYKVASTLQKRGIKTISLSLLNFDKEMYRGAFSEIICLDLPNLKPRTLMKEFFRHPIKKLKFFLKLLRVKADVAICQGAPHYLAAFFIWLFKGKFPRIYFPYDMNFSRMKNPEKCVSERELWGERHSFRNCDAIIYKAAKEELDLLPKSFNLEDKPKLGFSCYTLNKWFVPYEPKKKLSYKNKEIHIVHAGLVKYEENKFEKSMFPNFTEILKQKIHLHIYCSSGKLSKKQIFQITQNKKDLKIYLHIHKFVPPEKLSKEICKYDFGSHFFQYTKHAKPNSIKFSGAANKVASYLEASMPFIVNEENWINSKMIKQNYLGISLKNIKSLKGKIKKFNYLKSIKNIQKFRKEYSLENNIHKLIKFIKFLKRMKDEKSSQ